ncbi:MAG: hypothetical protein AABZ53_09450 [Planctomycetota bacterium]
MKPSILSPRSFGAPVMRRVSMWCVALSSLVVLATIAYVVLRQALDWPRKGWSVWIPLATGALPMCVILPFGHWLLRGIRRDWEASDGRLCTDCGYNVSGLPPAGTCPECGHTYDIDRDLEVWKLSGLSRKGSDQSRDSSRT